MQFIGVLTILIFIYVQTPVKSTYDSPCQTTCSLSGMICVHGRCKCNSNERLFWTGARCLNCPNSWAMSATACITMNSQSSTQARATAFCENMKSDLITVRDLSILPLIYQVTSQKRRRRQTLTVPDRTVVWTSAHAVDFFQVILYRWSDSRVSSFDGTYPWWCRVNTPNLGFSHLYNEPTRQLRNNEYEKCVILRRGRGSIQTFCLDDVLCSENHYSFCELSEATALKWHGPALTSNSNNRSTAPLIITINGKPDPQKNQTIHTYHSDSSYQHTINTMNAQAATDKGWLVTIAIIIILSIIVAIITGIIFYMKHKRAINLLSQANRKPQEPFNAAAESIGNDRRSYDESAFSRTPSMNSLVSEQEIPFQADTQLTSSEINEQTTRNPTKPKPSGYSKQTFNEFD